MSFRFNARTFNDEKLLSGIDPKDLGLLSKAASMESVQPSLPGKSSSTTAIDVGTISSFDHPYGMYVTDTYTCRYAYPTIAYLHDTHRCERDLFRWSSKISDTNYLGIGVRAPFPHSLGIPGQFEWKLRRPDASIAVIRDAIRTASLDWSMNLQRVYLFGEGDGAIVALQHLLLQQTPHLDCQPVAGVICRNLPSHWSDWLPPVTDDIRGRVLFLDPLQEADECAATDAFQDSGLQVTFAYGPKTGSSSDQTSANQTSSEFQMQDSQQELSPGEVVNHWIMQDIQSAVF